MWRLAVSVAAHPLFASVPRVAWKPILASLPTGSAKPANEARTGPAARLPAPAWTRRQHAAASPNWHAEYRGFRIGDQPGWACAPYHRGGREIRLRKSGIRSIRLFPHPEEPWHARFVITLGASVPSRPAGSQQLTPLCAYGCMELYFSDATDVLPSC
jgi:hypothetical protein